MPSTNNKVGLYITIVIGVLILCAFLFGIISPLNSSLEDVQNMTATYGTVASDVITDFSTADAGKWLGRQSVNAMCYDYVNKRTYIGAGNGLFGYYSESTGVLTDLSATDAGDWVSTNAINSLYCDVANNRVYIAGASAVLGYYDTVTNVTKDLRATDAGNWLATNSIEIINATVAGRVYLGGNGGKVGYYNTVTNITVDLSATDAGNWIGNSPAYQLCYDSRLSRLYIGFEALNKFGYYDVAINTTKDLSTVDAANWMEASYITGLICDTATGKVYQILSNVSFAVYNNDTNVSTDLTDKDTGDWVGSENIIRAAYYVPAHDLIFLGVGALGLGAYDISGDVVNDLTSLDTANWFGAATIRSLSYDNDTDTLNIGLSTGKFGKYLNIGGTTSVQYNSTFAAFFAQNGLVVLLVVVAIIIGILTVLGVWKKERR
jgi:hypothetical protein